MIDRTWEYQGKRRDQVGTSQAAAAMGCFALAFCLSVAVVLFAWGKILKEVLK